MIKKIINKNKVLIREIILYGIIGGSTALADVLLFKFFRIMGLPIFISNFISVNIAIASSFGLNAKYNFKKIDNLKKRAIKFFLVGYVGLMISFLLLWMGNILLKFDEILIKMLSVIIVAMIQYILNKFLTFRK